MNKDLNVYNSVYKELVEVVGIDATLKIYMRFKGQQITFPVRLYNPDIIKENVINEFNGSNINELAKKYDYSERSIRRMLKND